MKITKDYGNSCLNYCVLHLFQHKTVAFQNFTILFLPFPSLFSLIITTFVVAGFTHSLGMAASAVISWGAGIVLMGISLFILKRMHT